MAFPVNVDSTWVNTSASYDAGELRRADSAAFAGAGSALGVSGGIVRHGDTSLAVTVDASDNVTIQAGAVVIPGNAVAGTGAYRSALATATTNALSARSAVNPRIDLIVFRQMDTDVVGSHGAYTGRIEAIAGTPSATPSAPALPSMAVELARITVPVSGGASASVDSSYRTYVTALGGDLIVPTSARLPAAAAKFQRARTLDTGLTYLWNGTAWHAESAWVDYTFSAAGFTQSSGRLRYVRLAGDTITVQGYHVISATGADFKVALPVPAATTLSATIGSWRAADIGTSSYVGVVALSDAGTYAQFFGNSGSNVGIAYPFGWTVGDVLTWTATYEAAPL